MPDGVAPWAVGLAGRRPQQRRSPAVAFDRDGRVLMAWAQHKELSIPDDAEFDAAFVQALEITTPLSPPPTGRS
ncbi:MAG: hypothetical protein ACOYYS_14215 [Chloroflexota bacterium]